MNIILYIGATFPICACQQMASDSDRIHIKTDTMKASELNSVVGLKVGTIFGNQIKSRGKVDCREVELNPLPEHEDISACTTSGRHTDANEEFSNCTIANQVDVYKEANYSYRMNGDQVQKKGPHRLSGIMSSLAAFGQKVGASLGVKKNKETNDQLEDTGASKAACMDNNDTSMEPESSQLSGCFAGFNKSNGLKDNACIMREINDNFLLSFAEELGDHNVSTALTTADFLLARRVWDKERGRYHDHLAFVKERFV